MGVTVHLPVTHPLSENVLAHVREQRRGREHFYALRLVLPRVERDGEWQRRLLVARKRKR